MPIKMSFDTAHKFSEDVEEAAAKLDQVLAHWHEAGQSHWTGGDRETGGNDAPAPRVKAAFDKLHAARQLLSLASHELIMHAIEVGSAAVDDKDKNTV